MNRITRNILPVAALVASSVFSPFTPGADMQNHEDSLTLEAAATAWAAAFNRGDVDAISAMYTDDAQLLPEGSEAIRGRTAILDFFRNMVGTRPSARVQFSHFEFYGAGPAVTERSDVEIRDLAGRLKVRAKQVLIRVRQNGQWKIHRDIWTGNGDLKSE